MIIYHNTNHVFRFTDRVRILFGKKLTVYSEISTKEDVEILGEASCKPLVDKFFPRKLIGAGYPPEQLPIKELPKETSFLKFPDTPKSYYPEIKKPSI